MAVDFWLPLLTAHQRFILTLSLLPPLVVTLGFLWWWANPVHHINYFSSIGATLLVGFDILIPIYFYFFICRMSQVNPRLEPSSEWRVALIVTKAPSEPWVTVRETLEAMLAQDVQHDTWLADEDPSEETQKWCQLNNVSISCRKNINEYNRESWPRRKKCKEGNLAFFYDTYGYANYDFVAQLDADHVPTETYLREILRPFHDSSIGYVAAPSICDKNKKLSWAARGRLFAEASLHGPLQAGYNNGWAPLCIGSHYAVRTSALKEIGGLGPELAEDHSTSLMMNAHGWKGAFQINAIAHGEGPSNFVDCMTQEFQWARSLTMISLKWTPVFWPTLSTKHKAQFLFSQFWYPVFSLVAFVGFCIPMGCLLFDAPLLNIDYLVFLIMSIFLAIINIMPIALLKRYGLLRPSDSSVISWEEILFTITRFPWSLLGVLDGVFSALVRKKHFFRVTPKGHLTHEMPLYFQTLAPYLSLAFLTVLVVILRPGASAAAGYYYLALLGAFLLISASAIVFLRHHRETNTRCTRSLGALGALLATGCLFAVVASLRLGAGLSAIISSTSVNASELGKSLKSPPRLALLDRPLCAGNSCFGIYDPVGLFPGDQINIDHYFVPWGSIDSARITSAIEKSSSKYRTPLITLEPWEWAAVDPDSTDLAAYKAPNKEREARLLSDIADGVYDRQLITSLQAIGRKGNVRTIVRLMHEMEFTTQYPWYSENPVEFIRAYRYVVDLSKKLGISNIQWMWSPAGLKRAEAYWPGDAYVDYVGISIYAAPRWNWGMAPEGENLSFETLMKWKYWVEKFNKPIVLAEVGVTGSAEAKKSWLINAACSIHKFPKVVGWIYFNQRQPPIVTTDIGLPDWSLTRGEASALASHIPCPL